MERILQTLQYKYPRYYITDLMDKVGKYRFEDTFSWNVSDRTKDPRPELWKKFHSRLKDS
jgi:hypothetical protein